MPADSFVAEYVRIASTSFCVKTSSPISRRASRTYSCSGQLLFLSTPLAELGGCEDAERLVGS